MVDAAEGIDAHQHVWRLDRGDYPWMPDAGPLHRDYLPEDYAPLAAAAGIFSSVLVQAAPTVAETEYMLAIAEDNPDIVGVVGWVDLAGSPVADLERLASHPKLIGVRPMIQDLADDARIARPAVLDGLKRLAEFDLSFDLLCYPRHLPYAVEALGKVPELRVVVDHLAKPDYSSVDPAWRAGMTALAALPNMHCKIAGLVTEVGRSWPQADFSRHFDVVYGLFGARRLMIGTDWPVLNTVASFAEVVRHYEALIAALSTAERAEMWAGTAKRFYRLVPEGKK